ncbi:carbon-nitrogen hydrolase family protein [Halobacillus litoralis]|uniref:carbon-nitrogen hydrolase family protein n=1 Tax=Halobacillus litoralis TaxID=45668 RepID=UPI0024907199|nr:carbon-nitrogen hydrolase family protein [Halobacillus litoralis]
MKVALVQMNTRNDKQDNINKALRFIDEAAEKQVDWIGFPEYFSYLTDDTTKLEAAEPLNGPTIQMMQREAVKHNLYIHLGSMIETTDENRVYNTSVLIDDNGEIIETYRKLHLFDVDVPGKVSMKESDTIKPGENISLAETKFGKVGMSICYDIRFPELYRKLALSGATILLVPAAFAQYTGTHHWETLLRARAIENGCFVFAAGQIGPFPPNEGHCFGNSMIIDPWGTVLARAEEEESLVISEINLDRIDKVRKSVPSLNHRREEVYANPI